MNKLNGFIIGILIFSFVTGCIDDKPNSQTELKGSTYTGVIPCADCEGIAYRLSLKHNHRFETRSVYIGKSNQPFIERGMWSSKGDSLLILDEGKKHPRQFKIKNNQLVMLDQAGKEVSGSLAKMYVLDELASTRTNTSGQKCKARGIDFHAAGNEPFWSFNIDFNKMMAFKTLNGDSITTPVPRMKLDTVSQNRLWNAKTESGPLNVKIRPTGCVDDMAGTFFNYQVQVMYNDETYNGCGNFINDTYKLNDFWSLSALNGKKINGSDRRKIPELQFDVAESKVFGNAGCNRLNGNIMLKDSSLTFSKLVTTKMACRGTMQMESEFLKALQKVDRYDIASAELLLMNDQDTLMVFHRTE